MKNVPKSAVRSLGLRKIGLVVADGYYCKKLRRSRIHFSIFAIIAIGHNEANFLKSEAFYSTFGNSLHSLKNFLITLWSPGCMNREAGVGKTMTYIFKCEF